MVPAAGLATAYAAGHLCSKSRRAAMENTARRGQGAATSRGDSTPWQVLTDPLVFTQPVAPFCGHRIAHQTPVANDRRGEPVDELRTQIDHFDHGNFKTTSSGVGEKWI